MIHREKFYRTPIVLILLLAAPFIGLSNELSEMLTELNQIDTISGSATGFAGTPGRFYLLSNQFMEKGQTHDFIDMTKSPHPATRIMGAYCLIKQDKHKHAELVGLMFQDQEHICWNPGGCMVSCEVEVGKIIRNLFEDPNCLGSLPLVNSRE